MEVLERVVVVMAANLGVSRFKIIWLTIWPSPPVSLSRWSALFRESSRRARQPGRSRNRCGSSGRMTSQYDVANSWFSSVHEDNRHVTRPHAQVAEAQSPGTVEDRPAQVGKLARHEPDVVVTASQGLDRLRHRQLIGFLRR